MRAVLIAAAFYGLWLAAAQADEGFRTYVYWPDTTLHDGMVECWQWQGDTWGLYAKDFAQDGGPLDWWLGAQPPRNIPRNRWYTFLAWWYNELSSDTMFSNYPAAEYYDDPEDFWQHDLFLQYNTTRPSKPGRP
ncbi:MAG: hypothetical protein ABIK86_00435 [candidate division WOR-3 bacterium]